MKTPLFVRYLTISCHDKLSTIFNCKSSLSCSFNLLKASLTRSNSEIISSLKYTHGYVQDKTMEKHISPSHFKCCTGIAGTVILAATGGIFHRGKVPVSSDRYTVFFDYTSRKPIVHNHYGASFLNDKQLQLLAKNLTPQQKECVFWKDNFCKWLF